MSKRSKQQKAETLIEYLEPLSDITAIDIEVKKKDSASFICGRYQSSTNKKLVMIPYSSRKDCGIYVELFDDDLDYVEVKTVRSYSFMGRNQKEWELKERYDRTMHFEGNEMKILGRFLRMLSAELSTRLLPIDTNPKLCKPELFALSFINAAQLIGKGLKKKAIAGIKAVTRRRKKEFFFKEKISEANNADEL